MNRHKVVIFVSICDNHVTLGQPGQLV